jgi:hypothetical protein
MSRARLRRLERAVNASAASQVIQVYGHLPDLPLSDDDPAHPDTPLLKGAHPGATASNPPAAQAIAGELGAVSQRQYAVKGAA